MSQSLKVLILGRDPDVFPTPGGAPNDTFERHVGYVRELVRKRPDSEVRIIAYTRRPSGHRFAEPFPGMRLYGTFSGGRLQCPMDMARLLVGFRQQGWIPDVISCQTGYEEGPLALLLADKRSRIQVQVHSDYYGEGFAGQNVLRAVQRNIIRRTIRRCDQARVVSRGIERALVESGDIDESRISFAPAPIVFQAATHCSDPSNPVVLFVGRLVAEKDLGLWCDAAEIIHQHVPAARFWIVGDGPEREMLERLATKFPGNLRLFGARRYAELAEIYAKSSIFMLTSRYEGSPRVIVEAMLAGVPVVAPDMLGPQDLISDGVTGRLTSRDAQSLATAAIELINRPALASNLASNAKQWAEENHNFDSVAAKLVEGWEAAARAPKRAK